VSRRTGLIGQSYTEVDPIPEPNRHIPTISADCRVYFPPNATTEQIATTLTTAYLDVLDQLRERES
jgi:hypothetical protein